MELTDLLHRHGVPHAAIRAAASHGDLVELLVEAPWIPDDVFAQLWDGRGRPGVRQPDHRVTTRLLRRHLSNARRRDLVLRNETRPAFLAQVLRRHVPTTAWRRRNLEQLTGPAADAVLANPRWPAAEKLEVVRAASVPAVIRWATTVAPDDEFGGAVAEALDARAAAADRKELWKLPVEVVRDAVLRWPQVAALALRGGACEGRSAAAVLVDDPTLLGDLTGHAARCNDPIGGPPLVEALWANPALPRDVRDRLAGHIPCLRVACHYVRPAPESNRLHDPVEHWGSDRIDEVLAWASSARDIRHLSAWVVARLLAAAPLTTGQARTALRLLEAHGRAAGVSPGTARWLARRHGQTVDDSELALLPRERTKQPRRRRTRNPDVEHVVTQFGDDQEAWDIAVTLLRDGWEHPGSTLVATVRALTGPTSGTAPSGQAVEVAA